MHDFEYVSNYEWKPIRDELFEIIYRLQNEVRNDFTFQYYFVGSSQRKMITRDRNSNRGFEVSIRSLILMDIRFSDMIIQKTPPVCLQSK